MISQKEADFGGCQGKAILPSPSSVSERYLGHSSHKRSVYLLSSHVCFHLTVSPSQILELQLLPLFQKLLSLDLWRKSTSAGKYSFFSEFEYRRPHVAYLPFVPFPAMYAKPLFLFLFSFPLMLSLVPSRKILSNLKISLLNTFPGFLFCSSKFPATALKC